MCHQGATSNMVHELILASILAIIVLYVILYHYRSKNSCDIFQPIVFVSLVYLTYCVVGPLFRILTGQTKYLGLDMSPYYFEGFIAALVSYISIFFGYKLRFGILLAEAIPAVGRKDPFGYKLWSVGWVLIAFGFIGFIVFTVISGTSLRSYFFMHLFSESSSPSGKLGLGRGYIFMELITLFLPGYLCVLLSRRFKWTSMLLLLLPIISIYAAFGYRYRLIATAIAIGAAWHLYRNVKIKLFKIVLIGIAVCTIIGLVGLTRNENDYSSIDFNAMNLVATILYETNIFETSACTMSNVPSQFDFVYYKPFLNSIALVIPRLIWPEKDMFGYSSIVHRSIGTNEAYDAGVAYMLFCEYYMIYGWLSMVIGCVIFGVACRAFWIYFLKNKGNIYTFIIYPMFLTFVFVALHRGYIAQHMSYFLSAVALPSVVVAILTRRKDGY